MAAIKWVIPVRVPGEVRMDQAETCQACPRCSNGVSKPRNHARGWVLPATCDVCKTVFKWGTTDTKEHYKLCLGMVAQVAGYGMPVKGQLRAPEDAWISAVDCLGETGVPDKPPCEPKGAAFTRVEGGEQRAKLKYALYVKYRKEAAPKQSKKRRAEKSASDDEDGV